MNSQTWRYIRQGQLSSAEGLACDEALVISSASTEGVPILHLYHFKPAAIVGRYQDIHSALNLEACQKHGIEPNRRATGGGTVLMGAEQLALGFSFPAQLFGSAFNVKTILTGFSSVLALALKKFGLQASFRPKNDLVINNSKIAGMALASDLDPKGNWLLFHTSLLVDFDVDLMLEVLNLPGANLGTARSACFAKRLTTIYQETGSKPTLEEVQEAVRDAFSLYFKVTFAESNWSQAEHKIIKDLVENKYTQTVWIYSERHLRTTQGSASIKTAGGNLQVDLTLSGRVLESILISGDFFSDLNIIKELESALLWSSCGPRAIQKTIAEVLKERGELSLAGVSENQLAQVIKEAVLKATPEIKNIRGN